MQVCTVPTYDGNPSVGHLSVVDTVTGVSGYRYWMAFTPFPNAARENPSIVASNDKVTWVVPDGVTNPVAPLADAQADDFTAQSDCDLVQLADGTFALYYRGMYGTVDNEGLYRRTSADGITWSEPTLLHTNTGTTIGYRSMAVTIEADDSYAMWATTDADTVVRYTSADGITWGSKTTCTTPPGVTIWHLDVERVGSVHFLLAAAENPYRLYLFVSTDGGLTFTGSRRPAVALSGRSEDAAGHYRSCMVPVSTSPVVWDLWVTGIDESDDNPFAASWRALHLPSVSLPQYGNVSTAR